MASGEKKLLESNRPESSTPCPSRTYLDPSIPHGFTKDVHNHYHYGHYVYTATQETAVYLKCAVMLEWQTFGAGEKASALLHNPSDVISDLVHVFDQTFEDTSDERTGPSVRIFEGVFKHKRDNFLCDSLLE